MYLAYRYAIIIFKHSQYMNIKITIKDADTKPLLIHKNQLSEVEFQKKNSLYQQPQRDKNTTKKQKFASNTNKNAKEQKSLRQTGLRSSGEQQARQQAERKMMQDLDKMSKNQASLEMIHNSNNILQKQNQILYENQKAVHNMIKNSQQRSNPPAKAQNEQMEGVLRNIKKQVQEMRKIKEDMEKASKEFSRTMGDANKTGKQVSFQGVQNVAEMNSNLKSLADISKNQLEGLQNLEAIKNLQNFNIQGYMQAINGLKKQIVQLQKESQQIERQLKLRAAKLDQITVSPNFNEQLLAPYQQYLKKKADSVDLHAMKDKIYEKIGHFDYGKFEYDISQIMTDVRGEMKEFEIICKQYRVEVPQIKIDPKQLKNLDLKLPSAIDEYKAERGIDFVQQSKKLATQELQLSESRSKKRRTGEAIAVGKQTDPKKTRNTKWPQAIRELNSKPIDLASQVKYQKTNEPSQKTILQNQREIDKKQVQRNMKKGKIVKEDEDFEKYLQYRAKQQLELLYKEKEERLKKMKNDLLQICKEQPEVLLNLDLRNQIKRQASTQKKRSQQPPKRIQPKEEITKKQPLIEQKQLKPIYGHEGEAIKAIGTQVLKEKLKNILGNANQRRQAYQNNPIPLFHPSNNETAPPQPKLQNIAQNFLSMINNTLTQVNTQISQTIQQRFQQRSISKQKREYERRSPPKIQVPKLEEFRPPPVFNMQYVNTYTHPVSTQSYVPPPPPTVPRAPEQKIVPKNYQHLEIKDSLNYGDLEISDESYRDDFE